MAETTIPTTLRIGIDCRLAGWQHAGIGRYVENLITRLPTEIINRDGEAQPVTWVLFFHDEQQAKEIKKTWSENVELKFVPVRHYTLKEQLILPKLFAAEKLDLLHVPHFNIPWFYRGKIVVTIHDLLWHEQRGNHVTTLNPLLYWLKYWFYLLTVQFAVTKAEKIFVPAQTILETVKRYYPSVAAKIVVTVEGVGSSYLKTAQTLSEGRLPNHKTTKSSPTLKLVYTGSLYPHKNVSLVLQALQQHPEWHLTLVGARTVFQDKINRRISELNITSQVTLAGYLTDQELIDLYQASDALVQPSFSEGFGLTGVEAMATGTIVLASDIPIFHEIYQSVALFFNPHSVAHFGVVAQYLTQMTSKAREQRRRAGLTLAQTYRWPTLAKQTVAEYSQVL
jgi:glycosyltransferase involved in cell wall biosynthesis